MPQMERLTIILPSGEEVSGAFDELILRAARIITSGELVALPTETVYGLGANALNPEAVAKIFTAKGRPSTNPLIVHIADLGDIERIADLSPEACRKLPASPSGNATSSIIAQRLDRIAKFWPGPLSVILPKQEHLPAAVTANGPTVAVRIPAHPVASALIRAAGCPIAAPSANRSGHLSPTSAQHVRASLKDSAPTTLNGGSCTVGLESTVLNLTTAAPTILRPGAITAAELEAALNEPITTADIFSDLLSAQISPGLSLSHYAPDTPLFSATSHCPLNSHQKVAAISLSKVENPSDLSHIFGEWARHELTLFNLSDSGDLSEAAAQLFRVLHEIEGQGYSAIVIQECPTTGIGLALADRIRRASAR